MHLLPAAALAAAVLFADAAAAQRGGRNRRPEEIQERVGAFFADTSGPAVDGEKVADLDTCELVRAAAAAGQPTVLYLHDGTANEQVVGDFEKLLFRSDALGIKLRCFHCGRIDVSKEPALKARFGDDAPLFAVFDGAGKAQKPLSMKGYKADPNELEALLDKAAKGHVKPSLEAFAKGYADLVRDLEQVLAKKELASQRRTRAGDDPSKQKKADKDLQEADAERKKLLDKEQAMLEKLKLPARPAEAKQLGRDSGWGGGGGGGGSGGGRGGGGSGGGAGGGGGGGGSGGGRKGG